MAEIKKADVAVKPVATIKTAVASEVKTPEVKAAPVVSEVKAAPVVSAVKTEVKKEEPKKAEPKKAATKKTAAKKSTAKKASTKKTEPKAETKKAATKTATKKTTTKKTAAKKTTAKKSTTKKAAAPKAASVTTFVELQYSYKHISYDELIQNVKNHFQYEMGGNVDDIKKINVYVKPEEDAAYYVINDKVQSRIGL